jgi:hypothetical protein
MKHIKNDTVSQEMYTVQILEDMLVLVTHYVYMTNPRKLHRLIVLLVTNQ